MYQIYAIYQMYAMSELNYLRLMYYKKMYRSVGHYSITIFRIAISALRFFQCSEHKSNDDIDDACVPY